MQDRPRKKVLYVITQSEWGGAQRYVHDLAINAPAGWEVFVAFGEQGKEGAFARALDRAGLGDRTYALPSLVRRISPFKDIRAMFELVRLIGALRPDIVHLNSSKASIVGSLAAFISGLLYRSHIHTVYTAHGWVFLEPLSSVKRSAYLFLEQATAFLKDGIICVSHADAEAAQAYGIGKGKCSVIHNGIAPIEFFERNEARKHLGARIGRPLDDKTFVVGSIGNLYATKGYAYLVAAASRIVRNHEKRPLFIVIGEGAERSLLERRIHDEGLQDTFLLLGALPDASRYLKGLDLYVSSSVKEGLSYTLIEALQAGAAIIATDVGGNAEIVRGCGKLVPARDAEAIAEAIMDPPRTAATKEDGVFSLEVMLKKTFALYEGLF